MDSDDLSLIEIAGEDDSLLQPIPGGVSGLGAGRSGNYFMCSPLHLPRSHAKPTGTGGTAANEDLEDMKNSFYRDSVNKENLNIDKAEMVKLSIEPQQMKRKKKGGGYNLRKSLAWDRAFFTEEGVLDPMELSMISGSFSKSKGETLSDIQEEDSNCDSNSLDMQALEENLFKKLPVTTSEIMNNGGSLLPKKRNNEAPTSMATRKVLSAHNVNRTGSKRNTCPQPLASSSLKRPANLVTTTSAKYSKVSKVPVQKTNPSAPSRIAKSSTLGATDSKHITCPVNVQKYSGLKGSSNNAKNVVNSSKAGPAGKSSTTKTSLRQAKRTVLPLNKKASGDFEVTPNPPLPSTQLAPNIHHDVSSKSAVSLPQTSSNTGVSMQHTRLQTAKPSGLRMPSPSLGFFGQSKAPPLQNPLKRTSQPSNLPESVKYNLRKLGAPPNPVSEPRPPLAPGSLPEVIHDGAKTGNIKASCSSLVCTVPSAINLALDEIVESVSQASNLQKMEQKVHYNDNVESDSQVPSAIKLGGPNPVFEPRPQLASRSLLEVITDREKMGNNKTSFSSSGSSVPSAINAVPYEIAEPDSQISNLQKMEQKVLYNDNVSKARKSEKELHSTFVSMDHQILGQAGQCMGKSTSQMEDEIKQRNDDNFLQMETLQGVDKHGSDMKVFDGSMTNNKGGELESPELTSQSISAMEVTALSVKSDINDHQFVEDKPSYLSIEHGISSKIIVGKYNDSEPFGEQAKMMNTLSCEAGPISSSQMLQDNVANINPEVQDYNVSETGKSDASSHLRSTDQENVDTNALDKVKAQLNFEDAGMQSLDGNTPVKSSESYISTLLNNQNEVVVSDVTEKPEYLEFPNSLLIREDALQDGVMLHVSDCSFGEKNIFLEESKQENNIQSDEPEVTDACESEMNCPMPVSKQDSGSDTAKLSECENQEDIPPVSVDSKPAVENCNLDAQFQHDVGLHDHCSTMELGNMDEDYLTDAVSAESEHLGESGREVTDFTCEPSLIVQVEGNSWTSHTDEHDDAEDRKINLSAESSCHNSNSQPEDKFSLDHDNSSMGQIFVLRGEIDVSNHQENEDKQVMPCFPEGDRISYEEKQNPEARCLSLEHSHSREEPQKSKDGNSADVKLEVSVHDGSGLQNPGLSLHEQTDQALKESEIVNCMIGEPDGNSELQDSINLIEEVFPISVTGVGLNHVSLANNSAEVFNGENDFENVHEECNEAPIVQVDDLDVNKNAESLELAVTSSFEIAPSVKNVQRTTGVDCMIGERDGNSELLDPVNQIEEVFPESVTGNSAEVFTEVNNVENVLEERNEAPIVQVDGLDVNKNAKPLEVEVAMTSSLEIAPSVENTHCATRCRNENEPSNEANSPKSYHYRSVSNSQISVNCTLDIEQQHELENTLSTEDKDVTKDDKKSGIEKKQDTLVVKPPPYAAPFSDEWLAAFEAAGEEILTIKSGAVQNSPEDRSQSEPGPWSPVKRKHNQAIGPFDCTKYTNTNQ